jgi:hypothetical protein
VLYLTVDSAEQLPAVEAVIAAMYGVAAALSSLDQEQLVHALLIADMVHAEAAAQQAMEPLTAAAQAEQGLSATALEALIGLTAWPAFLLKLLTTVVQHAPCCRDRIASLEAITAADSNSRVQRLLVAALGDLEAVWADKQLTKLLLELPLPAMQLLLSSDQPRVASEDAVLFTAQQCINSQKLDVSHNVLRVALAPLVRAPHLLLFPLSCMAVAPNSSVLLMGDYDTQLRSLLCLNDAAEPLQHADALESIRGFPPSWRLGPRQIRPLADGVRLEWRLEQLRQACRDSFARQQGVYRHSPGWSPALCGRAWGMLVHCICEDTGTQLRLLVGPKAVPDNVFIKSYSYTVICCGVAHNRSAACAGAREYRYNCYSCSEAVFPAEPMASGWMRQHGLLQACQPMGTCCCSCTCTVRSDGSCVL